MRIYLDNCCYNRPYDMQENVVKIETEAKLFIQSTIKYGDLELVSSCVLFEEISKISSADKRNNIMEFITAHAKEYVGIDKRESIIAISRGIIATGIKTFDAAHVACAIIAHCDYFITTDKRLLKYKTGKIKLVNPIDFVLTYERGIYEK